MKPTWNSLSIIITQHSYALGIIDDERAVNPLIGALEDEKPWVRFEAAWSLGDIGNDIAVDPLVEALDDESNFVRVAVAYALGRVGGKIVIQS